MDGATGVWNGLKSGSGDGGREREGFGREVRFWLGVGGRRGGEDSGFGFWGWAMAMVVGGERRLGGRKKGYRE